MIRKIKKFRNGSFLEFDCGSFDEWCVYFTNSAGKRRPPSDIDYFLRLKYFARKYGVNRIYEDFLKVYYMTGNAIDTTVLDRISALTLGYDTDAVEMDVIFTILYMAMIAEERKKFTRLGKRIKRLGVHTLLIEGQTAQTAANFTRGMSWRKIDALCRARGF